MNLEEKIKTGKPLNDEDVNELYALPEKEREKMLEIYMSVKQKNKNSDILKYFIDEYTYLVTNYPEVADSYRYASTKLTPENFDKSYNKKGDHALNELLVSVIQNPSIPEWVKESAKEKLFDKNIGLIGNMLHRFSNKNDGKVTMEDLGQDCKVVFFEKCVGKFDCTKGFKFSTFAMNVLHNYIVGQYTNKYNKMRALEDSLEDIIVDEGGSAKTLLDYQVDPNPTPEEAASIKETNRIIYDVLNYLPTEQKFIAYCRYGLGGVPKKTQAEIAGYMRMSQANVSKIEGNMLVALKKMLDKEGVF